ncbi:MAG: FG-GAP repeat protein, partial [Gammaproteobacteria bacterium]
MELTAPDDRADDHFGASVALSSDGRTVLVGLPNEGNGFGAINIYPLRAGQW